MKQRIETIFDVVGTPFLVWTGAFSLGTFVTVFIDCFAILQITEIAQGPGRQEQNTIASREITTLFLFFLASLLRFSLVFAQNWSIRLGSQRMSQVNLYLAIDQYNSKSKLREIENSNAFMARTLQETQLIFNGLIIPAINVATYLLGFVFACGFFLYFLPEINIAFIFLTILFSASIIISIGIYGRRVGRMRSKTNKMRFTWFGEVLKFADLLTQTGQVQWLANKALKFQNAFLGAMLRLGIIHALPKHGFDIVFLGAGLGYLWLFGTTDNLGAVGAVFGLVVFIYRMSPIISGLVGNFSKFTANIAVWKAAFLPIITAIEKQNIKWQDAATFLNRTTNPGGLGQSKHHILIPQQTLLLHNQKKALIEPIKLISGSSTLMFGKSGAGKSTIAGAIFDKLNENYQSIPLEIQVQRADISHDICATYLEINTSLFHGTLRQNMILSQQVTEEVDQLIKKALDTCCVSETLLSMGLNLDSELSPENNPFSDGEMARIAIARELIWCNTTVIIDETISNIDASTANQILANIKTSYPLLSILVISHNQSIKCDHSSHVGLVD